MRSLLHLRELPPKSHPEQDVITKEIKTNSTNTGEISTNSPSQNKEKEEPKVALDDGFKVVRAEKTEKPPISFQNVKVITIFQL